MTLASKAIGSSPFGTAAIGQAPGSEGWHRRLIALVFLAMLWGCAAPLPQGISRSTPVQPLEGDAGASTVVPLAYRLNPADEVEIRFPGYPSLTHTARVGLDGRVMVPHLRPIMALGMTIDELNESLARAVSELIPDNTPATAEYLLRPGDDVEVRFAHYPTLNLAQRLRPDGRLSLPLVKGAVAQGKSAEALEAELTESYRAFLRRPQLSVIVRNFDTTQALVSVGGITLPMGLIGSRPETVLRSFAAPQVFVAGEVQRPGMLPFRNRMTLLQAIVEAGGNRPGGELRSVLVLRKSVKNEALTIRRNVLADLNTVQTNDMELQPSDIVIIPKTSIASTAELVDQYVYQLLSPLKNSGFNFLYNVRGNTNY